jgi:hypothetical protein
MARLRSIYKLPHARLTGSPGVEYPWRMYSRRELVILAKAYLAATGMAASTLGTRAAGNDRLFIRLLEGRDCKASSAEAASLWFEQNWPAGDLLRWPVEVRRLRLVAANRRHDEPGAKAGMAAGA